MLAVLEYKAGNQTSVKRALDSLRIPNEITANPEKLKLAEGVIFPGVGAAGSAMEELRATGLDMIIRELVDSGKPLLGICIGCQVLLDHSQENDTRALGIFSGQCLRFDENLREEDGRLIRIPHMGWNGVKLVRESVLFEGVDPSSEFYFVHTYYPSPPPEMVIATTYYGHEFCSAYGRPGLWATQFHPEKSGNPGLKILSNFYRYSQEVGRAQ